MNTSLDDARWFCDQIEPIIRGPEEDQDLDVIRRLFRAYLHCWKCILHFVREAKGLKKEQAWIDWCATWQQQLKPGDRDAFEYLRKTRDHDTHVGIIKVDAEIAAGLFPIVMFEASKQSGPSTELIPCCRAGLAVAKQLIGDHATV